MREEILSIPDVATRFLDQSRGMLASVGAELRRKNPPFMASIARGSSDHAAAFLKYASELTAGVPVASLGPSVASIYGVSLKLGQAATLSISQSGKSPDIVSMTRAARQSGALTIAITNAIDSDLARTSEYPIDILAGPERSVAATKSFVSSAIAGLALIAHWTENDDLLAAIDALPAALAKALACDWSPFAAALKDETSLFVLGRGPSLAISNEIALKFKETSGVHAESYSAAEVMHGPKAIVGKDFPILVLASRDAAEASIAEAADRLAEQGAAVFITSDKAASARTLPFVTTAHPLTDPLAALVSFYAFVEAFARSRGHNPDQPPHLRKVTETL
ncbi:SIS domain-containing protein [Phyllobacterium sp. 21LDTY02-6]|uniref:SIS domain-containing protein n=1 Tax=Phyllobacterium sp. 21LDTY02-6 TaxID=2944903 RepID=UPI00201FFD91|nr:SIS domain-containing protein [Phyllobacterium sp. 21LDTY02-6]MCO4315928.1 SIS domain-containing protein [Phyllobacterium sp. 21LDTY02-6]